MPDKGVRFDEQIATKLAPIWSTACLFYLYLDLYVLRIILLFQIGNCSDVVIEHKIVFYRPMEDPHKRSHMVTGNMPHKPA